MSRTLRLSSWVQFVEPWAQHVRLVPPQGEPAFVVGSIRVKSPTALAQLRLRLERQEAAEKERKACRT